MEIKQKIKNSFGNVKRDFDVIKVSFADWVNYLRYSDFLMKKKLEALEARINELEESNKLIVTTY